MYDEYGSYGQGAAYPDASGYPPWGDPYVNAHRESVAGYQSMPPMGVETFETAWDPSAELEQLLQTSETAEFDAGSGQRGSQLPAEETVFAGIDESTAELPRTRPAPVGHRKRTPARDLKLVMARVISFGIATLAAIIVSAVSVLGGLVALDPLRDIAEPRISEQLIGWWPLLVYGPWIVASLSILRASIHRRRALHSWSVVLFFSTVATLLCVAQAPWTPIDIAAAALPSLAALACFQQLVRLITLLRPPRQALARHRARDAFAAPVPAADEHLAPTPIGPLPEPEHPAAHPVQSEGAPQRVFPRQQSTQHGDFL